MHGTNVKTSVLSFIYFVPGVVQWAEFVGEYGTLPCLYTAIKRKPLCCVTTICHLPALPRIHWAPCSRRCWTSPHTFQLFHFMPSLCLAPSRKLPKGYRFGLHKGVKWFQQQLTEFFAEGGFDWCVIVIPTWLPMWSLLLHSQKLPNAFHLNKLHTGEII
jgi:hypothetical protein